jgi:hypothetical protein
MLFDIRGRRRHVVRVVYAILALLMGGSLFLVIGPFNIADIFGAANATDPSKVLNEQAERIESKLRVEPDNEDLLLSLTRTRIAAGNALTEVDPETGVPLFTPEGRQELLLASEAWDKYLKEADEPNPSGALLMADGYFSLAESAGDLGETEENIERAAETQRIAAEGRPNVGSLTTLATYEYFAGDFAAGDAAAKKAEGKAPKIEAKEISKQLAEYRQRGKSFAAQKKKFTKLEKEQGKEALQNPLGGLSGGGAFGQ